MADHDQMTDEGVLEQLGERLSRYRLDRNLTQAEVATEAGVHKNTVFRLEAGGSTQTKNLVRVLRALGLLDRLDAIVPEPVPSPIKQLKAAERQRKRAVSRKASKPKPGGPAPGWSWGNDDAGDDDGGGAS
ncbi:MAG: helix-turn-helix transcriptional regulator [Planctomycetota bacterium]